MPTAPQRFLPPLCATWRPARALNRVVADASGDPIPGDVWPVLVGRRESGLPMPSNESLPPSARPVDVVELAAAAGGGGNVASDEVFGVCGFGRTGWTVLGSIRLSAS